MINSLSSELDILRPEMLRSGLQVISHNLNRKNSDLRLYEFGKTYATDSNGKYTEKLHLSVYITGNITTTSWKTKAVASDYFHLKGIVETILGLSGIKKIKTETASDSDFSSGSCYTVGKNKLLTIGQVNSGLLKKFDIKQPVFYADINMDLMFEMRPKPLQFKEISRFPAVNRDLALVVDKNVSYSQIEQIALSQQISHLKQVQLFDIFESEKLGKDKKSMAVSFNFQDDAKTLTDKEIDGFMSQIISSYEKNIRAEIRK
jgi:phenylalanyl-tRNA synthetase beta chain